MYVKRRSITRNLLINLEYRPALRYAFGSTIIMALTLAFGGYLGYIVPYLALNFLALINKVPSLKKGFEFVLMVTLTSLFGFLFTSMLYDYKWVYMLLLGLILFYIYYNVEIPFILKLFMVISLLAYPVPELGIDASAWAFLVAKTFIVGSVFVILVIWMVYALFPDVPVPASEQNATEKTKPDVPDSKARFNRAVEIFIVTFPIVLLFIFYQWEDGLLVLIYIVVLAMMPDAGKSTGKVKIYGNLIGGAATLIFYTLIVIVPNFFFFIVLFLGTALFFADKIFSGKPNWAVYRTAFAALVLIIGSISTHVTTTAGTEIWQRILMIMAAVFYVVGAFVAIEDFKAFRAKKAKVK